MLLGRVRLAATHVAVRLPICTPLAGPRKVNEGTGEMLQRVLETIETPARNLSEMHVRIHPPVCPGIR